MLTTEEEIYLAVLVAVSFFSVILIFFIINLLYNHYRVRKIQKNLISAELITLETERKRFSQDLHDEIGPSLSTVLLYVNMLEVKDKENEEIKLKMEEILKTTLQEIRSISKNIIPKYLQEQGLKTTLENMVGNINFGLNGKSEIRLEIESIPANLSEFENLNVYRIVQESVTNAIKHAQAEEIRIHLSVHNNRLNVIISDNGIGFDQGTLDNYRNTLSGIGLKNIQNRVIFLGGQLHIYSQKGKGTQIIAEIPIV